MSVGETWLRQELRDRELMRRANAAMERGDLDLAQAYRNAAIRLTYSEAPYVAS